MKSTLKAYPSFFDKLVREVHENGQWSMNCANPDTARRFAEDWEEYKAKTFSVGSQLDFEEVSEVIYELTKGVIIFRLKGG
jgi:hypothetical protein